VTKLVLRCGTSKTINNKSQGLCELLLYRHFFLISAGKYPSGDKKQPQAKNIYEKRYANFKEKQRKKQAARLKVQLFSRVIYMRARVRP
jgi:hypothetical protein